jgi:NitT/TauT family transport system ATP-binding protein
LTDTNFYVNKREFVTILGTNGSGKSTIFNLIAGIVELDKGEIKRSIDKNEISYIRQDYRDTLLPWKNNFDNISLPLVIKGENKDEYSKKTSDILEQFEIKINLKEFPYQLSGGQQQQVAISRGIVTEPKLLLLDEPFASLDFGIKRDISKHLLNYWNKFKNTIILITHDIDEAILLSDRILVIENSEQKIFKSIDIKLNRPRKIELMASVEFGEIKAEILKLLNYV